MGKNRSRRDTVDITSRRLTREIDRYDFSRSKPAIVDPINDTRVFHPDRIRLSSRLPSLSDLRHKIVPASRGYDFLNPIHWAVHPRQTFICARRRARKEVMFALHLTDGLNFRRSGRGGKKMRKPRYNASSFIKCRR